MSKLIEAIRASGSGYCPPPCYELASRELTFSNAPCVKCEEDLYLLLVQDAAYLYDAQADKTICSAQDAPCTELDGWCAELHFAQKKTFPCGFGEGKLFFEDEAIPACVRKIRERLYLVEAGPLTLVIDTARFLFYGAIDSRFLGGNIVNMELD